MSDGGTVFTTVVWIHVGNFTVVMIASLHVYKIDIFHFKRKIGIFSAKKKKSSLVARYMKMACAKVILQNGLSLVGISSFFRL